MSEPFSPEAYAQAGGGFCPICRSDNLSGNSVDHEGSYLFQKIGCLDCLAEWWDEFRLTRYVDLTVPLPDKEN